MISHLVLSECETLPLALSRAFDNSGPKKEDITKDWRKLHDKDLHELQSSLNVYEHNEIK